MQYIVKSKYIMTGCYMCLDSAPETVYANKKQPNNSQELKKKKGRWQRIRSKTNAIIWFWLVEK